MDMHDVAQVAQYLAFHLTKALTAFVQTDSFLYWPYLLSAAVIAVAVAAFAAWRGGADRSWADRLRQYVSARLWWHQSARADYRLYFANALVLPLLFSIALFADGRVIEVLDSLFGITPAPRSAEDGTIALRVAFTIAVFVAYDLGRFIAHSLLHDVPVLWEFHKVHHSAETLNPFTTFRAHPLDLLVMAWVPAALTGAVAWSFDQMTSVSVSVYTYLGMHVVLVAANLVGTLRHTHVWFSYGPVLGKWLISPAHHQLHHSCEPQHIGCNRGFEIAVWDRLYGTLYVPQQQEMFRMGLGDGTDGEWHKVRRMWLWPFVNAAKRLLPRDSSATEAGKP